MCPTIIADVHEKIPLSCSTLAEYEINTIVDAKIIENFGPNQLSVRFSLMEGEHCGAVSVEIIQEKSLPYPIGNVDFQKLSDSGTCLEKGAQIKSAYFIQDFRGLGLGITAYELIAKHYLLVSDTIQTHDGSTFWKFKLGDHDSLEVHIVYLPKSGIPYKMVDRNGKPEIYHYTREELEPKIWGLESPDAVHQFINASSEDTRSNVVLTATFRK